MSLTLLSRLRRKSTSLFLSPLKRRHLFSLSETIDEPASPDPRFLRHTSLAKTRPVDHTPFLRFPEVHVSTLSNGIRVVTQAYPCTTGMASVGVWIDAGSRFEAPGTNGTAHFLEHLIFKGTERRTTQSLEEEIENMGAKLNAYTSREQTTFFADVQSKDIGAAVDILADILQNSKFPVSAINRERGVILREMQEVQGQIDEVIFDYLHLAAFPSQPLGDTILGPEENIRSISQSDLERYISTHYTGPRTVVSAAGAVNHEDIVNKVDKLFTKFSTDPTTADQLVKAIPAKFIGSDIRVPDHERPHVHFAIAFEGAGWTDPSSIPVMILQSLLGSWNKNMAVGNCTGSGLARRISTSNLAESIMAFSTNYSDTGLFGVYCTAHPDSLHDLSCVIMEEFRRLTSDVSEIDVERARTQLKSALLLHIDGSTSVAENNGRQMLTYARVMPFVELFARIDAVDAYTVMETAKHVILNKNIAIAAVGPFKKLPDHSWFRSQTIL
ncbi:putative mitochondrial-processing peptidase subunit beta [Carex littledalei]|uniref:Putative mitochondrial-processing peptidase subunit beta n=1 Tax=Carex littledalei TaxID=544730 RepID=A0A833QWL6_9POAL|nr:putative mitochondrial-processing peptidase subunit beta [Carex littledalei]